MTVRFVADSFHYLFKLVVIGDSGVGKTNLLSRFSSNQFSQESKPTIGVEFATKTIQIKQQGVKIQVWDTAGQEKFRAITHAYYKGASGALLVFDLTRRSTFDNLSKWLKELKQNGEEKIVCILVGNKSDLADKRSIREDEIAQFAQENKLFYIETSALECSNVEKAFMSVVQQIYDQVTKKQSKNQTAKRPELKVNNKITLTSQKQKQQSRRRKKKCCE